MPRPRNSNDPFARFDKHAQRTFSEAAARYLAEFQGRDKTRPAQSIWATAPYIGHLRLMDVDDEAMAQFKEDRKAGRAPFKKPAMVGTINKDLTQVVTILNKAARVWRWIPIVPLIEHVKGPQKMPYPLTWEEQDRLFRCLPTGWDVGVAAFAVNTGCRKEEIFGLKWSHLRWMPELDIKNADGTVKERMFVFLLLETKNGMQRCVVLNSIARRAVEAQRRAQEKAGMKTDFVFPSRHAGNYGGRVRGGSKVWENAWRAAGLPTGKLVKMGLHNCRHTFAHRLRSAGVPQEDRNALLGHANKNLAEHYSRPDVERLLAHAEKITQRKETTILRAVG
jgi:integrase